MHSQSTQITKMELLAKIISSSKPLTIFTKKPLTNFTKILNARVDFKITSGVTLFCYKRKIPPVKTLKYINTSKTLST